MEPKKEKTKRQLKIVELINKMPVRTQEHLIKLLAVEKFKVTQATISRDIKELSLIKIAGNDRKSKYVRLLAEKNEGQCDTVKKHIKILKETVLSSHVVGNLVVVKCVIGGANAACRSIDCLKKDGMVGSIAGDDSIILVFNSNDDALNFVKETHLLLGF
ncbi:MAG: arginine repressor [Oscillospiraceae bacterium]|jgi:transcriptional regulator of arginine metabolism|nr:arginine repressor [Oscillospiraceae bacterium]